MASFGLTMLEIDFAVLWPYFVACEQILGITIFLLWCL